MSINQTKKILLGVVVLLTFLLFFQACEKSGLSNLTGTVTLTKDETKTITYRGKRVDITAVKFVDSRCPINADCVWQGYAIVDIKFKNETTEQIVSLCIGACNQLSRLTANTIQLNGITYKVTLDDVSPYPSLDKNNPEVSKATITISKS